MNPEVKKVWLAALRGKLDKHYPRTAGRLRRPGRDGGYCCLGVLCDLSGFARWRKLPGCYEYVGRGDMPTVDVLNWAGFAAGDADLLAAKNDGGVSFEEIADWIEKNL